MVYSSFSHSHHLLFVWYLGDDLSMRDRLITRVFVGVFLTILLVVGAIYVYWRHKHQKQEVRERLVLYFLNV